MAPPPPPAGIIQRRRRRRKTDGAPPSQPKLSVTAAAEIFTAHRGVVKLVNFNALKAQQQSMSSTVPYPYSLLSTSIPESQRGALRKI